MLYRANLQDWPTALMLGIQDSLLLRIAPRFLTVDEGDILKSLTVTYRSMRGQHFPGKACKTTLAE